MTTQQNLMQQYAPIDYQEVAPGGQFALQQRLMEVTVLEPSDYKVEPLHHTIDDLPDGHLFPPARDNGKQSAPADADVVNHDPTEAHTSLFLSPKLNSAVKRAMIVEEALKHHLAARSRELLDDSPASEDRVRWPGPVSANDMDYRFYLNRLNYIWIRIEIKKYMSENCQENDKSQPDRQRCRAARRVREAVHKIRQLDFRSMDLEERDRSIQEAIPDVQLAIEQMVAVYADLGLALPARLDWVFKRSDKFFVTYDDIPPRSEPYTSRPVLEMPVKVYKGILGAAAHALEVIHSVMQGEQQDLQEEEQHLLTALYQSLADTLAALDPEVFRPEDNRRKRNQHMEWIAAQGVHDVNQAYDSLNWMVLNREEIDPSVTQAMEEYYNKKHRLDDYEFQNRNLLQEADVDVYNESERNREAAEAQQAKERARKTEKRRAQKDKKRLATRLAQEAERAKKKAERAAKKAMRKARKNLRNAKSKGQVIAEEAAKNANKSAPADIVKIID